MLGFYFLGGTVLISKGDIYSLLSGLRLISITADQSKVYERLVSSRLRAFIESEGAFPRDQCAYRRDWELVIP